MNEHIEYFKRFSDSYMRWTHFNFDRIVADVVRKDKEAEAKRKEEIKRQEYANSPFGLYSKMMNAQVNSYASQMAKQLMIDREFMQGGQWKVGDTLRIKLPGE